MTTSYFKKFISHVREKKNVKHSNRLNPWYCNILVLKKYFNRLKKAMKRTKFK